MKTAGLTIVLLFAFWACQQDTKAPYQLETEVQSAQTTHYEYTFAYPVLTNDTRGVATQAIDSLVTSELGTFTRNAIRFCNRNEDIPGVPTRLEAEYEILENSARYLSLRWTIHVYWSGAYITSLYFATYTYDKQAGRQVTLNDFVRTHFDDKEVAAQTFSLLVKHHLPDALSPYCKDIWSTTHPLDDFMYFNLTSEAIHFIFDDFILQTSTCGNPEVVLNRNDLPKLKSTSQ